jgi:hypothetical protein
LHCRCFGPAPAEEGARPEQGRREAGARPE